MMSRSGGEVPHCPTWVSPVMSTVRRELLNDETLLREVLGEARVIQGNIALDVACHGQQDAGTVDPKTLTRACPSPLLPSPLGWIDLE